MSNTILYFDCFSGISGDMAIGALLDLGCDGEKLKEELGKLNLGEPVELGWQTVNRGGITATKFDVGLQEHSGEHHGHHHDGHHSHGHRAHRDIVRLIHESSLAEGAKQRALGIFAKIARAEAKIHGVSVEEVHFHEVGAVDSIIDIVGVSLLLESLSPELIIASPVALGSGQVDTMHGRYPVPAPATLEILKGAPVEPGESEGELTTPTGAALLAASVHRWGALPEMQVQSIGYGAGSKEFHGRPDVLRVVLGTGTAHHHDS